MDLRMDVDNMEWEIEGFVDNEKVSEDWSGWWGLDKQSYFHSSSTLKISPYIKTISIILILSLRNGAFKGSVIFQYFIKHETNNSIQFQYLRISTID